MLLLIQLWTMGVVYRDDTIEQEFFSVWLVKITSRANNVTEIGIQLITRTKKEEYHSYMVRTVILCSMQNGNFDHVNQKFLRGKQYYQVTIYMRWLPSSYFGVFRMRSCKLYRSRSSLTNNQEIEIKQARLNQISALFYYDNRYKASGR